MSVHVDLRVLRGLFAWLAAAIFVAAWVIYAFSYQIDIDLVGIEYALFLGGLPVAVGVVVGRWPGVLLALSVLAVPASSGHCERVAVESDAVLIACGGGMTWWEVIAYVAVTALLLAVGIASRRTLTARVA